MITTDLTLEAAFLDAHMKAKAMKHGRLVLVVEKFDKCCTDWEVKVEALNAADIDRLMRGRPRGWGRR